MMEPSALPALADSWPESLPPELATLVLDEAPEVVAISLIDGTLLYLNQLGRAYRGIGAQDPLAGLTLSALQPEWAWQVIHLEGIPQAIEQGAWSGESAALHTSQGEVPVQQRIIVFGRDEMQWIASIMRDLSEAKRFDVERMEFLNRYETAIRLSGHVLLDWEPFSGRLLSSGDLIGLLGRDASEIPQEMEAFRQLVHPADLATFDREIHRTVTTRDSLAVIFRLRQRDGEYRALRAAGGFYLDRLGRFGRITALLSDAELLRNAQEELSALRARLELGAEEQVREARLEAEQARQAKSEFLSRMSHELRTPLNAILGFTQLLELEGCSDTQQESIDHIARAGQHLLTLINEVLDLSRVESGRLALNLAPITLGGCIAEVIGQAQAAAQRAGVSLVLELEEMAPVRVWADQQRMRQVLMNLLTNAIKFNRAGGTALIRCVPAERLRVRITITDDGPGIPPERLASLFTPLEQTNEIKQDGGGMGLGLALSRGIMRAMRGDMGVENEPGRGSTFWVEVPLAEQAETPIEKASQAAEPPPEETPVQLRIVSILYVEDEDLNVQLVRRILTDYPQYRLMTTMHGTLALELAREHRPDLILLDLNLPDISGEQVLVKLKENPDTRDVPVIMVTADVVGHRLERLIAHGAAACLTKPFRIGEFIRVVRDTLAGPKTTG